MLTPRRALPLLATLVVIAVNAAANIIPINGFRTGELSDLNPTGFTPAGWVFAIWSLIYLGLIAYGIAALAGSERLRVRVDAFRGAYLLNAAANAGWIFAWHYRQVELSLLLMTVILITLIRIFVTLRRQTPPTLPEFWLVDAPISLYFGWITTATLANLAAVFYVQKFYPFGLTMDQWALITVFSATALYVWMAAVTRDAVYVAVFAWAASGIAYRPSGITESVRLLAMAAATISIACVIWAACDIGGRRRRANVFAENEYHGA